VRCFFAVAWRSLSLEVDLPHQVPRHVELAGDNTVEIMAAGGRSFFLVPWCLGVPAVSRVTDAQAPDRLDVAAAGPLGVCEYDVPPRPQKLILRITNRGNRRITAITNPQAFGV